MNAGIGLFAEVRGMGLLLGAVLADATTGRLRGRSGSQGGGGRDGVAGWPECELR